MIGHPIMTQTPSINIKVKNLILDQVEEINFQGIILDNRLQWKSHTEA